MTACTKRIQRGYSAGERGRNRVRVFPDPKTGLYQIEWREDGRRLSRSLKHRDWAQAKKQADELAAGFASPKPRDEREPEPLTLEGLFDIYRNEVTPTKSGRAQKYDRRAAKSRDEEGRPPEGILRARTAGMNSGNRTPDIA